MFYFHETMEWPGKSKNINLKNWHQRLSSLASEAECPKADACGDRVWTWEQQGVFFSKILEAQKSKAKNKQVGFYQTAKLFAQRR